MIDRRRPRSRCRRRARRRARPPTSPRRRACRRRSACPSSGAVAGARQRGPVEAGCRARRRPGSQSASASPLPARELERRAPSPASATGMVEHEPRATSRSRSTERLVVVVMHSCCGRPRRARRSRPPATAPTSSSTDTDGVAADGRLLGGVVDRRLDAVEPVQLAARSGRRRRRRSCPRGRGAALCSRCRRRWASARLVTGVLDRGAERRVVEPLAAHDHVLRRRGRRPPSSTPATPLSSEPTGAARSARSSCPGTA